MSRPPVKRFQLFRCRRDGNPAAARLRAGRQLPDHTAKEKTMSRIIAAVALTAAFIIPAAANEPSMPRGEKIFARIDSNHDGKISLDELKPRAAKRFLKFDGDANGEVTSAEVDAVLKARVETRKARMMGRMDADKNGAISRAELDLFVDALFNVADADKDGGVTLAEAQALKRAKQAPGAGAN
jgi:EF hand